MIKLWMAVLVAGLACHDVSAASADVALTVKALEPLLVLPPLQQIELIQNQAALSPLAREVALGVISPELIVARRAELEAHFGVARVDNLMHMAVNLHVEARADARVMAGLDGLARQQDVLCGNFDGARAKDSAPPEPIIDGARLEPALVWPGGGDPQYKRRVHTVSSRGDELLINGKQPMRFRDKKEMEGLVKEMFFHPDDPGLLVTVYHSQASLKAFEAKDAKTSNLGPLSAAGAAPKLIEHGEAVVEGKGRVYFYVQELVEGRTLREHVPDSGLFEEASRLFKRLVSAGIALVVPGPSQDWLLSRVMLGKTSSGGSRAYLLGGSVEGGTPEELEANYEMLLSMVRAAPATPAEAAPPTQAADGSALYAPPVRARLEALEEGSDLRALWLEVADPERFDEILEQHKIKASAIEASETASPRKLRLASEVEVAATASALLSDSRVSHVKVHPALKAYLERRGGRALYQMLKLLPKSGKRDELILKIAAPVFAGMASEDVADVLSLMSDDPTKAYGQLPPQAWGAMELAEAQRLLKQWASWERYSGAYAVVLKWLENHGWSGFAQLSALLPDVNRVELATQLPAAAFEKWGSSEILPVLQLLLRQKAELLRKLPERAWLRLERQDLESLVKQAVEQRADHHASPIPIEFWMKARYPDNPAESVAAGALAAAARRDFHELIKLLPLEKRADVVALLWPMLSFGAEGKELAGMLSALGESLKRDGLIAQIPPSAYEAMDSAAITEILMLLSKAGSNNNAQVYQRLPKTAWHRVAASDFQRALRHWTQSGDLNSASFMARAWLEAHGEGSEAAAAWKEFWPLLASLPESSQRDSLLLSVPGQVYAALGSAEVASLLSLASQNSERKAGTVYGQVPQQAWQRLSFADFQRLAQAWLDAKLGGTAVWLGQAWAAVHDRQSDTSVVDAKGLRAFLMKWSESGQRDQLILYVPGSAFDQLDGAETAAILALVMKTKYAGEAAVYNQVAPQAYLRLRPEDLRRLVDTWVGASCFKAAAALIQNWVSPRLQLEDGAAAWQTLRELAARLPASDARDTLIVSVPGPGYSAMSGPEVADFLSLVSTNGEKTAGQSYDQVGQEAWQRMGAADLQRLLSHWLELRYYPSAANIAQHWLRAHGVLGGGGSWASAEVRQILTQLGEHNSRDQLLLKIPGSTYEHMDSSDIADILSLFTKEAESTGGSVYNRIPEEAWQGLKHEDLTRLLGRWSAIGYTSTTQVIEKLWSRAQAGVAGANLRKTISLLPLSARRDERILSIPEAVLAKTGSRDLAGILELAADGQKVYPVLAAAAWQQLSRPDAERLIERWIAVGDEKTASLVLELWMREHQ